VTGMLAAMALSAVQGPMVLARALLACALFPVPPRPCPCVTARAALLLDAVLLASAASMELPDTQSQSNSSGSSGSSSSSSKFLDGRAANGSGSAATLASPPVGTWARSPMADHAMPSEQGRLDREQDAEKEESRQRCADETGTSSPGTPSPMAMYFDSLGAFIRKRINEHPYQSTLAVVAIVVGVLFAWDGPRVWKVLVKATFVVIAANVACCEAEARHMDQVAELFVMVLAMVMMLLSIHSCFGGAQTILGALLGFVAAQCCLDTTPWLPTLPGIPDLLRSLGVLIGIRICTTWQKPLLTALTPLLGGLLVTSGAGVFLSRGFAAMMGCGGHMQRCTVPILPPDMPWAVAAQELLGPVGPVGMLVGHFGCAFLAAIVHELSGGRLVPSLLTLICGILAAAVAAPMGDITCDGSFGNNCTLWLKPLKDWCWPTGGGFVWAVFTATAAYRQMSSLLAPPAVERTKSSYDLLLSDEEVRFLQPDQPSTGSMSTVSSQALVSTGVRDMFANEWAFAALKYDGSVVVWGDAGKGGHAATVANELAGGVQRVFATIGAFAAIKSNGSVVTWGDANFGGESQAVAEDLKKGVVHVYSTVRAFAALTDRGGIITWGHPDCGGNSKAVADRLRSGVTRLWATSAAFAALTENGDLVTWGDPNSGGVLQSEAASLSGSDVKTVFSSKSAFAALTWNGSVVAWGAAGSGGCLGNNSALLQDSVVEVFATRTPERSAFAALKADGSVVTWGDPLSGGDSSAVAEQLSSGVVHIVSNARVFVAVKADGSLVSWGHHTCGGGFSATGVRKVYATMSAFAAVRDDGSVLTWGRDSSGGDSRSVSDQLAGSISRIFSTVAAFAALRLDGSIVSWGNRRFGGDLGTASGQLQDGVMKVWSTETAFAALKVDGTVVTWGDILRGGDCSQVASQLCP